MRLLRSLFASRRVLRDISGIHHQLERQADLLQQLVSHLVPEYAEPDDEELRVTTGISRLSEDEMALALELNERMERTHGRAATDKEVLEMLAWRETQREAGRSR